MNRIASNYITKEPTKFTNKNNLIIERIVGWYKMEQLIVTYMNNSIDIYRDNGRKDSNSNFPKKTRKPIPLRTLFC